MRNTLFIKCGWVLATALPLVLGGCCACGEKKAVRLFNGKDLAGWNSVSADPQVPMERVWSVKDGEIVCQGTPVGAIHRGPKVKNFRLKVEYRWAGKAGNSGVFSRITPPLKPIPQSVETQLFHGSAGDVMGLQGRTVAPNQPRFFEVKKHELAGDIAGVKKLGDFEKPVGEWNQVEILAQGPRYTVWINGHLANQVEGVEELAGPVGLQSEGEVVHFRNVVLEPLD